MESDVINDYINNKLSIEKICNKYKIGKLKLKDILNKNNIPINKKGTQKKHQIVSFEKDYDNKVLCCKKCNLIINDVENKSGGAIKHINECLNNIQIPSKFKRNMFLKTTGQYWHFQYFNVINKENNNILKCPQCNWITNDLENKSGSFTKHVNENHISIHKFLKIYPDMSYLFNKHSKSLERENKLNIDHVICQICGKKLKLITNKHLEKHNITLKKYKLKYPNSKIVNNETHKKLSNSAINTNKKIKPKWSSKGEIELVEFIKTLKLIPKKLKNLSLLEGKEIDICVDNRIAFEYNGLYYHTEKMGKNRLYHLNKTISCNQIGIDLYHIFEDEWVTKNNIVKSKIKQIFKLSERSIGARKIKIKLIDKNIKSNFLTENHIQGNDKSNIFIGGYFNDELVGVMTFNTNRNMTKRNEIYEYELSRFATKLNINCIGLGSKFIKFFIKNYNPKKIITFADRRWTPNGENNFYTKIGFNLSKIIEPNYFYYNSKIDRYKRYHKFGFGKNNLRKKFKDLDFTKSENELMKELGYDKIWDCGLFKYELNI